MERAEAVAFIEKRRDAWLREDINTYLRMFHDDFTFTVNGVEVVRGRLALENAIRRSYLRFRPAGWEFSEIAVDGQHVLAEWVATTEERATGVTRSIRAMSVCEMHDGLTVWQREYRLRAG
jgi:ketosteroid isomerase-like protein